MNDERIETERVISTERGNEPVVVREAEPPTVVERKLSVRSFIAGFVTAAVVAALGLVIFLAVSDSDDNGDLDVDVPAVDVDVND